MERLRSRNSKQDKIIEHHVNHGQVKAAEGQEGCEDWQLMSEIPNSLELMATQPAYIPPNDIDMPYSSKKEYLNIQYQLKRYEAVEPLRAAISGYKKYGVTTDAALVYTKVSLIISPKALNSVQSTDSC